MESETERGFAAANRPSAGRDYFCEAIHRLVTRVARYLSTSSRAPAQPGTRDDIEGFRSVGLTRMGAQAQGRSASFCS